MKYKNTKIINLFGSVILVMIGLKMGDYRCSNDGDEGLSF
jgi:hypothetical protein